MSHHYANFRQIDVDEARYQTIGRGHGFDELGGVVFKIADKYRFTPSSTDFNLINELGTLHIGSERLLEEAYSYSFELEMKVLANNTVNGS